MPEAVFEQGVPEVAEAGEDDHARQPDFKTVEIEAVDGGCPAKEEVVHEGEAKTGCDTV